jgi:hypothetical protein
VEGGAEEAYNKVTLKDDARLRLDIQNQEYFFLELAASIALTPKVKP